MKKRDQIIPWIAQGFYTEDGIEKKSDAALYVKINKMFSVSIGLELTKENLQAAKNKLIDEVNNYVTKAIDDFIVDMK